MNKSITIDSRFDSGIEQFNQENYETLLGLVGELVIQGATTRSLSNQTTNDALNESVDAMSRLIEGVRDHILRLRSIPLAMLFAKYQQILAQQQYPITVNSDSGEALLENAIVDKIDGPFVSLLNALVECLFQDDHGAPLDMQLTARKEAGSVVVGVSVIAEQQTHRVPQCYSILNNGPEFMQLHHIVEEIQGFVKTEISDTSLQLTLHLPLSQSIIDGFLVQVGAEFYVIPLEKVDECMETEQETVEEERDYINLRGKVLPLLRLQQIFHSTSAEKKENIVVIKHGDARVGLVVDELHGEIQAVNKPLGRLFEQMIGVSGSTILGGGEVALILDVAGLIQCTSKNTSDSSMAG